MPQFTTPQSPSPRPWTLAQWSGLVAFALLTASILGPPRSEGPSQGLWPLSVGARFETESDSALEVRFESVPGPGLPTPVPSWQKASECHGLETKLRQEITPSPLSLDDAFHVTASGLPGGDEERGSSRASVDVLAGLCEGVHESQFETVSLEKPGRGLLSRLIGVRPAAGLTPSRQIVVPPGPELRHPRGLRWRISF